MFFRKKLDEINKRLQQVIEENQELRNEVTKLKKNIEEKDILLGETQSKYRVIDGVLLSEDQSAVVDLLDKTNECFFITGKAGTGKSTVLKYFVANTHKKVVTLAPTGIAANIVNGRTIHSFFGLNLTFQEVRDKEIVNSGINAPQKLLEELDSIIIDEASMIRADVMDMIDHKLRSALKKNIPYGGIQIILFGDLFQLAPVVKDDEATILQERYGTPYFFGAPSAEVFTVCGLTEVFRQRDSTYITTLNKIRYGMATQADLNALYKSCITNQTSWENDMYIVPTNKQVNKINDGKLSMLAGKEYTYQAECQGDATEDDTPACAIIKLKVGAVVMMLCNDNANKNYVNGTLAQVVELSKDLIRVQIAKKGIVSIDRYTWSKYKYIYNEFEDKIETQLTGTFTQFPLKLAYAVTVHKSQGQTFDHITIDYQESGAFAPGQTYVALSRCRRLEDIHLTTPIEMRDIKVSQEVINYMRKKAVPALRYSKNQLSGV